MPESFDAVVAGHICLDITPAIYSQARTTGELFRPGSLVQVGPSTVSTGGPVSNTGFPLRRLGMKVALMGKVGDDTFGRAIVECIKREAPGAEAGMRVVVGEHSSYTVVVAPPGIDRIFLHCTGANDTFGAEDVDLSAVRGSRLFHFGYPTLMARTYAAGGGELVKILQAARQAGATISLDMAYPDPAGPAGKVDWARILAASLPFVDVFTPSVEELSFMLRREAFERMQTAAAGGGDMLDSVDGELLSFLGSRCIEAGVAVAMIKCGRLGIYCRTAGRGRLEKMGRGRCADLAAWTNRELFEPSYAVEKIVTTNGAGDCAIAAFLTALLRGQSLDDALRYACAVGAQNLSAADTISGVRTWEETVKQVAARPAKNDVKIVLDGWRWDEKGRHYVGPADGKA
jgi:sugar/nucleoside kinase (ribokinase family)